jgi:DNA-binding IclR family transcriptional regulator
VPPRREAPQRAAIASGDLSGGPMKMLEALAGARDGRAKRTQLGMLAGFSAGGGTFAKYLSTLRSAGLVEGDGSTLVITAEGAARVGKTVRSINTAEVHSMWRAKLGGGPRKMLDALIGVWPHGLSKAELGEETGFEPSGGTFAKYLSTLSGLDLVERRGGTLVATDALFPTGAPR